MSSQESPRSAEPTPIKGTSEHVKPTLTPRGPESTALQRPAAQPVKGQRVPRKVVPATQRPLTPGEVAVAVTVLDAIAVLCMVTLTVFLASFAVRNSDFWLHLSTGRLIAQGGYTFGVDPFASTTEGTY